MNILIVDDEPALVEYLTKTVSAYYPSHRVRGVVSARDAIGAASEEGVVDLLIADIHLGDSNGFEVCSQLQPIYPGMQTVFISGSSNHTLPDSKNTIGNVLRKPLGPNEIFGAVEAMQQKIRPRIPRSVGQRPAAPNSVTMPVGEFPVAFRKNDTADFRKSALSNKTSPGEVPVVRKTPVERGKHPIWLPALLSVLTLGVVITLIIRDTRLLDQFTARPIHATAAATRVTLRDLPSLPIIPHAPDFHIPGDMRLKSVALSDRFEGSDRPLELEAQWEVLPLTIGAHEIVVGEGAVRVRASRLLVALFTPGVVSQHYSWTGSLDVWTKESGRIGFVFGYQNPEDYFQFRIDRSALRIAVVRQIDGIQETLWDAVLPENIVSSEFPVKLDYDSSNRILTVTLGKSELVANIPLEEFEGGRFGLSAAETSFSRFSGFELTLTPIK